jgi:hypothetical protein
MSVAPRSIVIPLATNLFVAYDTETLALHTAWRGGPLNLWGSIYHGGKDRFYCDYNGTNLFTNPALSPWLLAVSEKEIIRNTNTVFRGVSTGENRVTLLCDVRAGDEVIRVEETPAVERDGVISRHFTIAAGKQPLLLLAHSENSKIFAVSDNGASAFVPRESDVFLAVVRGSQVRLRSSALRLEERVRLFREQKSDTQIVAQHVTNNTHLIVEIPPRATKVEFDLIAAVAPKDAVADHTGSALPIKSALGLARQLETNSPPVGQPHVNSNTVSTFAGDSAVIDRPAGDNYYRVEHFPLPKEIALQVTGMDFLPDGKLAVCTWLGEIFLVDATVSNPRQARYRRFARGLIEPCGLQVADGEIYVVQKSELTRLRDTDGDGVADRYDCINQSWGFTGNYHDFSFGPMLDSHGDFYVLRVGNRGVWEVPWMGWAVKISRDGSTAEPFCSGLRSPNGFGTFAGDLFATDNQGNWIGACKLIHLQRGKFYGFPSTTPAPERDYQGSKEFSPPAIWFPYTLSKSASGITTIADDRFGPFKGQMIVGEFQNATVLRVALEKVNGQWQGAVWPFAKGFWSGVNRVASGPDGRLYVGGCKNVAWAAIAPKDYSLDRVTFTGRVPFEVKEVHAEPNGFALRFTKPVDIQSATNTDNYDVTQFAYKFHATYGSPPIDHEGRENSSTTIKILRAEVSEDAEQVRLIVSGWRKGFVTAIRMLDVKGADAEPLWHDTFYYTLNEIPR